MCDGQKIVEPFGKALFFDDGEMVFVGILNGWVVVSHDFEFLELMIETTHNKDFSRLGFGMFESVFNSLHDFFWGSVAPEFSLINLKNESIVTSYSRTSNISSRLSLQSEMSPICSWLKGYSVFEAA